MKSDTRLVQGRLGLLWAQLLFSWLVGTGHFSASWSQQLGGLCAGVKGCQPVMHLQSTWQAARMGPRSLTSPEGPSGPLAISHWLRWSWHPVSAQSTVGRASTLSSMGHGSQLGVSVGTASLGAGTAGRTLISYRACLGLTHGSCTFCELCVMAGTEATHFSREM